MTADSLVLYKIRLTHKPIVFCHKLARNDYLFSTVEFADICKKNLQWIWNVKSNKANNNQ
jgi:hypothetical protein